MSLICVAVVVRVFDITHWHCAAATSAFVRHLSLESLSVCVMYTLWTIWSNTGQNSKSCEKISVSAVHFLGVGYMVMMFHANMHGNPNKIHDHAKPYPVNIYLHLLHNSLIVVYVCMYRNSTVLSTLHSSHVWKPIWQIPESQPGILLSVVHRLWTVDGAWENDVMIWYLNLYIYFVSCSFTDHSISAALTKLLIWLKNYCKNSTRVFLTSCRITILTSI